MADRIPGPRRLEGRRGHRELPGGQGPMVRRALCPGQDHRPAPGGATPSQLRHRRPRVESGGARRGALAKKSLVMPGTSRLRTRLPSRGAGGGLSFPRPAPPVSSQRRRCGDVAQICNLPYRRFVIGRPSGTSWRAVLADAPQKAIPRNGRFQIWATALCFTAPSRRWESGLKVALGSHEGGFEMARGSHWGGFKVALRWLWGGFEVALR